MTLKMLSTGERVYRATSEFEDGRDGLGHPEPASKADFRAEVWDDCTMVHVDGSTLVLPTRHVPDLIEFMKALWDNVVYE